jgi:hypothetical protein
MKNRYIYLFLLFVIASCKNKNTNKEMAYNPDSVMAPPDVTAVNEKIDTAVVAAEMKLYTEKINNRIKEYDEEISELKKERAAEKDVTRANEYSATIEKREKSRTYLKETVDKIGKKINSGWGELKKEIERFFENEKAK